MGKAEAAANNGVFEALGISIVEYAKKACSTLLQL